jgi:drug/metabolite transporter (DMT)-like permease
MHQRTESRTVASSDHRRTELGLLLLALIWGTNFPIIKQALTEFPPLAFNALRFPLASAVLFGFLAAGPGLSLPRRADVPRILALGVLANVVYQLLFIYGLDHTTAGNASLLLSTTPVWTAILSSVAGHERLSGAVWVGLSGTVLGMVLVVTGGGQGLGLSRETLTGDLLTIVAAVTWSVYTVSGRNLIHRYGSLPMTAWTLWAGALVLFAVGAVPLARLDLLRVTATAWFGVAYAGVLAIGVAYMLWNRGVRVLGNARTAVHSNLVPVVALTAAWILLGERPTAVQLAGALVIIGGVTLTRSARERAT